MKISKRSRTILLGGVILAVTVGTGAVAATQSAGTNTTSPRLLNEVARQVGIASLFGGHGNGAGRRFGRVNQDKLAQFLGVTSTELQSELRATGATMATVAQAHGASRDELKAFIQSQTKSETDQAVAHGVLTQEQADRQILNLAQRLDRMIDRTRSPAS